MQVRCSNNISATLESLKCVKNQDKCVSLAPQICRNVVGRVRFGRPPSLSPRMPSSVPGKLPCSLSWRLSSPLLSVSWGLLGCFHEAFQDISNTCRAVLHAEVCVLDPTHEGTEKAERAGETFCEVFPPSVIQLDIHLERTGLCEGNFYEAKCVDSFEMKAPGGATHTLTKRLWGCRWKPTSGSTEDRRRLRRR